jgi:hypothetical protein
MIFEAAVDDGYFIDESSVSAERIEGARVVYAHAEKPIDLQEVIDGGVSAEIDGAVYLLRCTAIIANVNCRLVAAGGCP